MPFGLINAPHRTEYHLTRLYAYYCDTWNCSCTFSNWSTNAKYIVVCTGKCTICSESSTVRAVLPSPQHNYTVVGRHEMIYQKINCSWIYSAGGTSILFSPAIHTVIKHELWCSTSTYLSARTLCARVCVSAQEATWIRGYILHTEENNIVANVPYAK